MLPEAQEIHGHTWLTDVGCSLPRDQLVHQPSRVFAGLDGDYGAVCLPWCSAAAREDMGH